ncbi:MAG: tRNA-specific adenosine deaminase [Phycisphaerae bacterium]|nr:tRNA-specific adenosine deaminase [Phycisphaerae bacterium]
MMKRALDLAREAAARGEVPVGAVVHRDGEIIAEAANTREHDGDPVGHAELLALQQAGRSLGRWRLTDCNLVVTLEPCAMCAGAMVNARIGRVVWGADDPKAGGCRSLYEIPADPRLNHRPPMRGGVHATVSSGLLRSFFQARRKKKSC